MPPVTPHENFRPPLVAGPRFPETAENGIRIGALLLVPAQALPDAIDSEEGQMVRLDEDKKLYVFYNGAWHVDDGNGRTITPVVGVGPTVIDQVLTDVYGSVHWDVVFFRADGQRSRFAVDAVHDGNGSTDATAISWEVSGGAVTGPTVDQVTLTTALFGTGVVQVMQLIATSSVGVWSVDVRRGPLVGPGV